MPPKKTPSAEGVADLEGQVRALDEGTARLAASTDARFDAMEDEMLMEMREEMRATRGNQGPVGPGKVDRDALGTSDDGGEDDLASATGSARAPNRIFCVDKLHPLLGL